MSRDLSRRQFMAALAATAGLAGCGTRSAGPAPSVSVSQDPNDKSVVWANWTLYLDYNRKRQAYPTLERFEEQTGYTVEYREDIDDNVSFNGKVAPQLARGMDIGYDLVTPSDSLIAPWIKKGWAAPLDKANIPNSVNLLPELEDVPFDPGRVYSLTYQSGFGGLAWNKERVPNGLRTMADLWDPALKGKVVVLSEVQDTVGLVMLDQGVDVTGDFTADQFMNALDVIEEQVQNGQIKQIKGNSYKEDLINEQAWAAIAWSGDIFQINAEQGDKWDFALPESGGTLWSDNFIIPYTATNKSGAEAIINYYYDPAVAAEVAAWVNYVCPVKGAREELAKTDPELAQSEWIFPTPELLAQAQVFRDFTADEEREYTAAFGRVIQS
ncbi:MAG: spermidine/putrescine ABC transporter substrate-binding protein [Actinobacteria bacterium]|nr:spermidine/putrescine ABC transporter substrate-binding protein [Micrococcales bacterium]MCB9428921.1 spermidine/putrescine ABC transporter substrate-binding protein [Actinomycetota bacterium]MCP5307577.1 spermidine/putrescine ABC transporter substrate-binding protein [Chromatiaceae bacterium]HPJ20311.1 spermidine/putrescine ABC transporter substrate-binding protein [Actinomycetota bacterium]